MRWAGEAPTSRPVDTTSSEGDVMGDPTPDPSHAYWAGYLAEHLRVVLTQANPNRDGAATLAIRALADFDAWCEQRDGGS